MKHKIILSFFILLSFQIYSCNTNSISTEASQKYEDSIYAEYIKDSCDFQTDDFFNEFLDGENFKTLISKDSTTMFFPFTKLTSIGAIKLYESNDKKLRLYVWRDQRVLSRWLCVDYICQYMTESGEIRTNDDILPILLSPLSELEGLNDIKIICDLKDCKENSIYIFEVGSRPDTQCYYNEISAIRIDGDTLMNCHAFPDKKKSISVGYEGLGDWYSRTGGYGWEWINSYDAKTKSLYIPLVDEYDNFLKDRYNVYTFNGRTFELKNEDGGFWLNPGLRSFSELKTFIETKDYIVRVDLLNNEMYRYVSWKKNKTMLDEPDMILTSKKYDSITGTYIFIHTDNENNKYEYCVKDGNVSDSSNTLIVRKNGKVILRQNRTV